LCNLLVSSKAIAAIVDCHGCKAVAVEKGPPAPVSVFEDQFLIVLQGICSWIRQHGSLMSLLELRLPNWSAAPTVEATLQAAAAAAPSGLLELHSFSISHVTREMLEVLSPQHLQSLVVDFFVDDDSIEEASQLLCSFTALGHLHLKGGADPAVLQSVLPALTNLRTLQIGNCNAVGLRELVEWIPACGQLQDLEFLSMAATHTHESGALLPLNMGHLSALTAIRSSPFGFQVQDGDVLPPMLQAVVVSCTTLRPLLRLQQLRDLTIHPAVEDIGLLEQLSSSFTGLTALKLCVDHKLLLQWHQATAGQWQRLPLGSLAVGFTPAFFAVDQQQMSPALQVLQTLTGLTSLQLLAYFSRADAQGAAACLQQLTNLRSLHFERCFGHNRSTMSELLDAVATLPQLQQLKLSRVDELTDEAVRELSRLSRLTALSLNACNMADADLSAQALLSLTSLTDLRSLSLRGCGAVCDGVIAGLAISLQKLTTLDVSGTGVTATGVKCLSSLQGLQLLTLPYHIR
jgi:Leucine-rich repeat (LRR) protein